MFALAAPLAAQLCRAGEACSCRGLQNAWFHEPLVQTFLFSEACFWQHFRLTIAPVLCGCAVGPMSLCDPGAELRCGPLDCSEPGDLRHPRRADEEVPWDALEQSVFGAGARGAGQMHSVRDIQVGCACARARARARARAAVPARVLAGPLRTLPRRAGQ